jgi:hypothetical protein
MHGSRVFNGAFRHDVTVWLLPSFFRKRFVLDYLSNTVKILKISKDSIHRRYMSWQVIRISRFFDGTAMPGPAARVSAPSAGTGLRSSKFGVRFS